MGEITWLNSTETICETWRRELFNTLLKDFRKTQLECKRPGCQLLAVVPGQQFVDARDLVVGDASEGVGEPGVGVDTA
ncbi:hypothetical protein LX81_04236 [Palleronia aestuarii]|uniref:Uncharacterized protein n=1 Tax=Palleronia aestuarii TaxID=568105 RepID=A0A2W7MQ69_9RHOB|nr:hypothetical protein LX81_04236 [Palleronia aestuarii]